MVCYLTIVIYVCTDPNKLQLCEYLFAGEGNDKVQAFKRWFWSIVEKMNSIERQELVGIKKTQIYNCHLSSR